MTVYIKNMVCSRCKMVVKDAVTRAGLHAASIELGELVLEGEPSEAALQALDISLREFGFEIIDNRRSRIIEKIKNAIITLIHHTDEQPGVNLSDFISRQLHLDYNYLSNLFSEVEGTTIEKYYIAQKIEKVKELLMYDELSLSQIAERLGYSSVAYLSNQFKKQTGLTPSFFKSLKRNMRRNIEDL